MTPVDRMGDIEHRSDRPKDFRAWAEELFDTHSREQIIDSLADGAESAWTMYDQLRGAVEALRDAAGALERAAMHIIDRDDHQAAMVAARAARAAARGQ
ncbi:MAG: hypothetical protein ACRDM7_19525 [Thermoleophilaceae bacterium]